MALFKVLRGTASSIDRNNANKPPFNDGYAYFTPDDGRFYIDVQLDTPLPANAYYDSGTVNGKTIYRIEIENQPMRELYTAINGKAPIEHHHYMSDINDAVQGVYFVKGTQTAATASWTGNLPTIDALYDGLTIAYYLPVNSGNNVTLTLTLKNSTTAAEPVYWSGTGRMTTHFGAGSVILLTWVSNATSGYAAVDSANGRWMRADYNTDNIPASLCTTGAGTAAKAASHSYYTAKPNSYTLVTMRYANTAASALTLNINGQGAKPIYINGVVSSATNYTLPAGTYFVFYDGTNYYFNTDGEIPNVAESIGKPDDWTWDKSKVSYNANVTSGTQLGTIVIDGNENAKIYAPNYTGSSPISVNASTKAISHNTSGVTADTYGVIEQDDISVGFGSNFIVPGFTVNSTGHITAAEDHKVILPSLSVSQSLTSGTKVGTIDVNGRAIDFYAPTNTNTTYTLSKVGNVLKLTPSSGTAQEVTLNVASSSADGLMTIADKQKLDAISSGATAVSYSPSVTSGTQLGTIIIDGNENAKIYSPKYTADAPISVSNAFKITHATSGPSTTGDTSKGDTTNKEPAFGATFKVLSATVNKYGHTTALGEHTVKIPSLSNSPTYGSTQGFLVDTLTINGQESNIYIPPYPTVETLGLSKVLKFIGFATTSITDGSADDPGITGYSTKTAGDVVIDANSHYEYVWTTNNKWERLGGDNTYALSGLEYDVTNGGTNAKSAVTISPKTATIHPIKTLGTFARGTSASLLMKVTNEKLTFTFDTNTPSGYETAPELDTDITVWTGYNTGVNNTYAAAQTFTPTTKKITLS